MPFVVFLQSCKHPRLDESTGHIDYDALEKSAQLFRPKLIIAGASAYSRNIDYKRMRAIAGMYCAHRAWHARTRNRGHLSHGMRACVTCWAGRGRGWGGAGGAHMLCRSSMWQAHA